MKKAFLICILGLAVGLSVLAPIVNHARFSHKIVGRWMSSSGAVRTFKANGIVIISKDGRGSTEQWEMIDDQFSYCAIKIGTGILEITPDKNGTLKVETGADSVTWARLEEK
jgi:hypothetical protein